MGQLVAGSVYLESLGGVLEVGEQLLGETLRVVEQLDRGEVDLDVLFLVLQLLRLLDSLLEQPLPLLGLVGVRGVLLHHVLHRGHVLCAFSLLVASSCERHTNSTRGTGAEGVVRSTSSS